MNNMDYRNFQVGDKVYLRGESKYRPSSFNPSLGSWHVCMGTVTRVSDTYSAPGKVWVNVKWDNGFINGYNDLDLVFPEDVKSFEESIVILETLDL